MGELATACLEKDALEESAGCLDHPEHWSFCISALGVCVIYICT